MYIGENTTSHFLDSLHADITDHIMPIIEEKVEMVWDKEGQEEFKACTRCWICEKKFKEGEIPVRDPCHFTSLFRGAAHNSCNLECKIEKERY